MARTERERALCRDQEPGAFGGEGPVLDDAEGPALAQKLMTSYGLEAGIYGKLLELSRRQGELLETSGDVDGCAGLFELKDELLRSLASIEEEIEPLKRRWWNQAVDPDRRERLNAVLDSILATIEAIMIQEQRNEQLLLQCHGDVEDELGHIQRGAEMHRTQADGQPEPRFMDIRR